MASKGIIHRNAAGRYKSRLTTRLASKQAPPSVSAYARRRFPPHNSTTSRSSSTRGSPAELLEVEIGPEQRVDGGRQRRAAPAAETSCAPASPS